MSRQDHEQRHGGDHVLGAVTAAQTDTTLMVGHIYGSGGGVVNVMMGRSTDNPEAIQLDPGTAAEVIGWLQQAIARCEECGQGPGPDAN